MAGLMMKPCVIRSMNQKKGRQENGADSKKEVIEQPTAKTEAKTSKIVDSYVIAVTISSISSKQRKSKWKCA